MSGSDHFKTLEFSGTDLCQLFLTVLGACNVLVLNQCEFLFFFPLKEEMSVLHRCLGVGCPANLSSAFMFVHTFVVHLNSCCCLGFVLILLGLINFLLDCMEEP